MNTVEVKEPIPGTVKMSQMRQQQYGIIVGTTGACIGHLVFCDADLRVVDLTDGSYWINPPDHKDVRLLVPGTVITITIGEG